MKASTLRHHENCSRPKASRFDGPRISGRACPECLASQLKIKRGRGFFRAAVPSPFMRPRP